MKHTLAVLLLFVFAVLAFGQKKDADAPIVPPKDTTELHQRIEKILKDNKVPGSGVVIADRNGIVWVAGIGRSDVVADKAVTPDTLFRIGSISKTFVALSALKLQSEGRLDLNATVRSLAPDVKFENRWEGTHPVRLVNLLEHTTGWDDLRFKEYANNDPKPLTLKEGLEFAPQSRTSRWKPGTRFSYCNSGPAVAAYVIEKVSGKRFEDYVKENLFDPIGMPTADYFHSTQAQQLLTKLYRGDGKTEVPYWNIIMRPAGALNVSPREMGNLIQFFLNRGAVKGTQLIPAESLARMETPKTSYGAQAGLKTGYGLHNYTSLDDSGFVWHGHNGGVEGGLSEMMYLPEQGVGYFFSINTGSGKAMDDLSKLMRAYLEKDLLRPALPAVATVPATIAKEYSGWYEDISPRNQMMYFIERIAGLSHVTVESDKLIVNPLTGSTRIYVPVTDHLFRREKQSEATLALMNAEEGTIVETAGGTDKRVSTTMVVAELGLTTLVLLAIISIGLFALTWVPRLVFRRLRGVKHLQVRVLPLIAVLSLVGVLGAAVLGANDILQRFGYATVYSANMISRMRLPATPARVSLAFSEKAMVWINPVRAGVTPARDTNERPILDRLRPDHSQLAAAAT